MFLYDQDPELQPLMINQHLRHDPINTMLAVPRVLIATVSV